MPLYTVTINGIDHTIRATPEQARRYLDARPAESPATPEPTAKAKRPANKSRTPKNKAAQ